MIEPIGGKSTPLYVVSFGSLLIQALYQAFDTCYKAWSKAKKVYSNDVHHLYSEITTMLSTKLENVDIWTYLGKLDHLIVDYNNLMSFTINSKTFY